MTAAVLVLPVIFLFSAIGLGYSSRCSPYLVYYLGQRCAVLHLIYPPSVPTTIPHTLLQPVLRGCPSSTDDPPTHFPNPSSVSRVHSSAWSFGPGARRPLELFNPSTSQPFHQAIAPGPEVDSPFKVFVRSDMSIFCPCEADISRVSPPGAHDILRPANQGSIIGLDNNEATYPSRIGRYIYIFTPYLFMFMWFMNFYSTSSATGSPPFAS